MNAKAIDVAQKYLDFLDSEKPAPSSRWLNLVNLLESFAAEARNEALEEAANKLHEYINYHYDEFRNDCGVCGAMLSRCKKDCIILDLLKCLDEIRSLESKPESGGKVK